MSQVSKYSSAAERQAAYRRRRAQSEARKAKEAGLAPLPAISSMPGSTRWRQSLGYAAFYATLVRDELQAYHDDRTERWQESDKGAEVLERIDRIEQIVEELEEVQFEI